MIDLSTWNLTIPAPAKTAAVISTEQLLHGYKSVYFHPTADGSGVVFWAPVGGAHTINSHYPRSELRETHPDGSLYNWSYPGAEHRLSGTLEINQVPSSNKIVIGQIHGYGDEGATPMIKLQYRANKDGGTVEALVRNKPDDQDSPITPVITGVALNARFEYVIDLNANGRLQVDVTRADGTQGHAQIDVDPSWADQTMYFKAGAYVQDNKGAEGDGGRVTFYKAQIEHLKP